MGELSDLSSLSSELVLELISKETLKGIQVPDYRF